jgi:hypothetical protein
MATGAEARDGSVEGGTVDVRGAEDGEAPDEEVYDKPLADDAALGGPRESPPATSSPWSVAAPPQAQT